MSRLFSGRCGSVSRMFAHRAKKEAGNERKREMGSGRGGSEKGGLSLMSWQLILWKIGDWIERNFGLSNKKKKED
jgi:hypothetical protein